MTLYILLLSVLPMAVGIVVLARHSDRLGLFHIYLTLLALSYGAYTFADVLVNSVTEINAWPVTVMMLTVTFTMIVTVLLFNSLPREVSNCLTLKNLMCEVDRTPFAILVFVWVLISAWILFAYSSYGIVGRYSERGLGMIDFPSWVGPVRQFFNALASSVFIWLVARLAKQGNIKIFSVDLLMLIPVVMLLSLEGRRVFLNMIVVGMFIIAVSRGKTKTIFSARNLLRVVVAFIVLVIFSNVYQTFRQVYLSGGSPDTDELPVFNLFDAILNFESTTENLHARMAMWRFHYLLTDAQVASGGDVMGGELLWEGLLSAVPRLIYPEKNEVRGDDMMVCQFFAGMCPDFSFVDIDYPQTLFSGLQADFGIFYIVLVPIFVSTVLVLVGYFGRLSRRGTISPILYILVFGASAELFVNIEQSVGNYFVWARDIALLTLCFVLLRLGGGAGRRRLRDHV